MRPLKSLPGCWVPACIAVSISAKVSPGVEQAPAASWVGLLGWIVLEEQ